MRKSPSLNSLVLMINPLMMYQYTGGFALGTRKSWTILPPVSGPWQALVSEILQMQRNLGTYLLGTLSTYVWASRCDTYHSSVLFQVCTYYVGMYYVGEHSWQELTR
jgi:hypothetical protein